MCADNVHLFFLWLEAQETAHSDLLSETGEAFTPFNTA